MKEILVDTHKLLSKPPVQSRMQNYLQVSVSQINTHNMFYGRNKCLNIYYSKFDKDQNNYMEGPSSATIK